MEVAEITPFSSTLTPPTFSPSDPLVKGREKSWERFLQMGLPSKGHEQYKYVPLRSFLSLPYRLMLPSPLQKERLFESIDKESSSSVLVTVNGYYQPNLSFIDALPKEVVVLSLREAMKTYGHFILHQWLSSTKEEKDPFVLLNSAFHQEGLFVYIPPNISLSSPLQILHVVDATKPVHILPRVHLFLGKGAQGNVVTTQEILEGDTFCLNQVMEATLDQEATLNVTCASGSLPKGGWLFDAFRVNLKERSIFDSLYVTQGSATSRHDFRGTLQAPEAKVDVKVLSLLKEKRQAHIHVFIDHAAPSCLSTQLIKSVLEGMSRSSFEGKILVRQQAQKTSAYQLNANLLLSDDARAYGKPNLEIFADDVKASHGATFGRLDQEQLFYLETRGLSPIESKGILLRGFCDDLLHQIPFPSLKREWEQRAASIFL